MKNTLITGALMLAFSSISAIATDRTSPRIAEQSIQNSSVELNDVTQNTSAWFVKASSEQAVSLAKASLDSSQNSVTDIKQTMTRTNASLDHLAKAIETMGLDVKIMSKMNKLVPGVVIKATEKEAMKLTELAGVGAFLPVYDSKLQSEESADVINATPLVSGQVASGRGITVAVLDSGVDYTHADMGGPGTIEAFEQASADLTDTPAWPIGNVIGGFDFLNNDPDPMDNETHGTHVTHSVLGIAPDVSIYAYTICDAQGACFGIETLAALEAAIDPNNDEDLSDKVDIINISSGFPYGTSREGAIAEFIDMAVELGVVVAMAAGNDDGLPFVVAGQSTTNNALSVAATSHINNGIGLIADFSSRGPSLDGRLKPEISAPGVGINTAEPGTGNGRTPINGTSFSSPITAGAIALLKEIFPDRNAFELKATLMNTADLEVFLTSPESSQSSMLAPISAIGAGVVNVEKASQADSAAWDADTLQAALSFGFLGLSETTTITKTVSVKNFSNSDKRYEIADSARYSDDEQSGALTFEFEPSTLSISPGQTASFQVTATFDPSRLPEWELDSDNVFTEAGGPLLTTSEYDGVITLTETGDTEPALKVVYHSLPIAYPEVSISTERSDSGEITRITNTGASTLNTAVRPVTIDSGIDEDKMFDIVTASLRVATSRICETGYRVLTTLIMRDPVMLTHQAGFFMDVDIDSDGVYDFTLQTLDNSFKFGDDDVVEPVSYLSPFGSDLSNLSKVDVLHEPGSNLIVLPSCLGAYGLTRDDFGQVNATVAFRVEDNANQFIPSSAYDADLVGQYNFSDPSLPRVVDENGDRVSSLAPGESAILLNASSADFTFFDRDGFNPTFIVSDSSDTPTINNSNTTVTTVQK